MRKTVLTTLFIFILFSVYADEGMWMLHLLKQQKLSEMQKLGLQLHDYDIYNPNGESLTDAILQFGSGCTGSVISSEGLVLTNHHCGYGQIQNHSSLENNYLENGFWAMNKKEELPNPGLTVTFIERIDDVTDYVKQCLNRDKDLDKDGILFLSPTYLNRIANEKANDYLSKNIGTNVEIKPFFEGNRYYMFTKKTYSDVRLVGAPPSSIGKFGADTDNWMWPRHTGDFCLFRIYTDKKGNPASYSPDNIPLKPKKWLQLSTDGVEEHDFAMIIGFPGTTNKYYTSWEVAERRDIDNDVRINMREIRQKVMLEEMLKDPQVSIQYASKYSGSTNGYKSAIGSNWAIDNRQFIKVKQEQQNQVAKWASANNTPKYTEALQAIQDIVNQRKDLRFRERMLFEGLQRGLEFANIPTTNADSLIAAFNQKDEKKIEDYTLLLLNDYRYFADKDYNAEVDKKISKAIIKEYIQKVPKENQPSTFSTLYSEYNSNVDAFVDDIFKKSIFGSEENLQDFVNNNHTVEALIDDPMFNFSRSLLQEARELRQKLSEFNNPFAIARRDYLEGILAKDGETAHFPDANLTLRLTYGQVKAYEPRDAVVFDYQTYLDGVMEKEDPNNWEFVVPDKLKELYLNKDFGKYSAKNGKMPVCFLATTHTTGGNSGSPVMNGKGELIGLNFDRNWEGVGGDVEYLPDYQRSIIVDVKYILFVIDKYAGAKHLIKEMNIK